MNVLWIADQIFKDLFCLRYNSSSMKEDKKSKLHFVVSVRNLTKIFEHNIVSAD